MRVLYCLFFCLVDKGCSHWGADIHSYNLRNRSIQPMNSDTWRNGVNTICSSSHDLRAKSNSTDAMLPQLPAQRRRRRRKLGRKGRKTKSLLKRMIQPTQQGVVSLQGLLNRSPQSKGLLRTTAPVKEDLLIKVASDF